VAQDRVITEVQGIVCASNERGLKLSGETEWRNLSKWAEVSAIPPRGSVVVLGLDKSGYVREITTATAEKPVIVQDSPLGDAPAPVDKDRRITRMACLNTATAILTTHNVRGGVEVAEVLRVAAGLEGWVLR
jgi:hypothetical protein